MKYYVYVHICLITGKAYIGWSINPKRRWLEHCTIKDNRPFHNAIRKYGRESFECSIIYKTANLKEVKQKEIEFIKQFNTLVPSGYNLTIGGEGVEGYKHTKEAIQKISESLKGHKASEEVRKRIKYARKKQKPPFQGRKHSNKTKIRMKIGWLKRKIRKLETETEV